MVQKSQNFVFWNYAPTPLVLLELSLRFEAPCLSQISPFGPTGCLLAPATCSQKTRFCLFEACASLLDAWSPLSHPRTQLVHISSLSTCSQKTRFCLYEACTSLVVPCSCLFSAPFRSRLLPLTWAHAPKRRGFVFLRYTPSLKVAQFAFFRLSSSLGDSLAQAHAPKGEKLWKLLCNSFTKKIQSG